MKQKLKFEQRFLLLAVLSGLPAIVVAVVLLWRLELSPLLRWSAVGLLLGLWVTALMALRNQVIRPLQTIANLLAALRQEDFSTRASGACAHDALGEVLLEINTLSGLLQEQRLGALEATALLRKVMEEIDLAVFAFDQHQQLKLVNRAGERLLGQPAERLLARSAADLNLAPCLEGEAPRTLQLTFPGGFGRWSLRRSTFWQGGAPHQLLVMADLSRALREEERQAWQRLVRVLGHEINNSLAPIQSISGSLGRLLTKEPPPEDWRQDMSSGLGVITARAEALGRFMAAYTQLARLPSPRPRRFEVGPWIQRVVSLETRLRVSIQAGPGVTLNADSDQLEQVLINLLRNAVDAALESHPLKSLSNGAEAKVDLEWRKTGQQIEIVVQDNGPGLANTANLFVPFFTTKPGGSGIGLVLCRQIVEAHGGSLLLENRSQSSGCIARLYLPLSPE